MVRFMDTVNRRFNLVLNDYEQLWQWSVDHIADFWGLFWAFAGIIASKPFVQVVDDPAKMPGSSRVKGNR